MREKCDGVSALKESDAEKKVLISVYGCMLVATKGTRGTEGVYTERTHIYCALQTTTLGSGRGRASK